MIVPDALAAPDDSPPQTGPPPAAGAASRGHAVTRSPRFPQLIPVAQLVAVVLGVLAIIWNQQQGIDALRDEFTTAHRELRAEVAENGQRLARIEGFLGIGVPDDPPPSNP